MILPVVIGIDPGQAGGIVSFDFDRSIMLAWPMPIVKTKTKTKTKKGNLRSRTSVDIDRIIEILSKFRGVCRGVLIEDVSARFKPKQATNDSFVKGSFQSGDFRFGFSVGVLHGVVRALGLPLATVHPSTWQAKILGKSKADETKNDSIAFCKLNWPALSLLPTTRCTKPSDGIADAACIAEYARRQVVGNGQHILQEVF